MRILLTGATGLLGSALLARLVREGHAVTVVARGRGGLCGSTRVRRILDRLAPDRPVEQVPVVDIDREGLGSALQRIEQPEAVIHAAAAVKFTSARETLWRENVETTARLLDALDARAPRTTFHFVSTAYICGRREGTCREDERGVGQEFRQTYEESKLAAEELVARRCADSGRPLTILRPSIIAGSSLDGTAANFTGFACLLRAVDRARGLGHDRRLAIPCDPSATKNVVPVDWVASVIAAILVRPARGLTYHLTHPRPVPHIEILEHLRALFDFPGLEITPAAVESASLQRELSVFTPYLWGEPRFDRANVERLPGELSSPPPIDRAFIGKLIRFGHGSRWSAHPLEEQLSETAGAGNDVPPRDGEAPNPTEHQLVRRP